MKKTGFITPQGLKHLDFYHYKSGKYTWMDNALQPYWNFVVSLVPMWVAPNFITLVGWLLLLSSAVIILCYDFTFKRDIPSWVFYYSAFCVWAYSTLDAIDGKQARRTKSSSPLGQLFDHGCDAFSVSFIIIQISQSTQLEFQQVFVLYMGSYTAFWLANWKEYNTGILQTNVGQFGVTECQYLTMAILILTGYYGQSFWKISLIQLIPAEVTSQIKNKVLLTAFRMNFGGMLAYYFGLLIIMLAVFESCRMIIKSQQKKQPLLQCLSLAIIMPPFCAWFLFSFFKSYIGVVLFSFGLLMSLLVCKIIISSVTRMKLYVFHNQMIPLIVSTVLMGICQYFGWVNGQIATFWTFLAVVVFISWRFIVSTVQQLSAYLGIYCFSLQKRPKPQNVQIQDSSSKVQ